MNNKISSLIAMLLATGATALASPAQAAKFSWDWTEADGLKNANDQQVLWVDDRAGGYDAMNVRYDSFSSHAKWFDTIALETEKQEVPEPMATAGLALVGSVMIARRRKSDVA